MAAFSDTWSEGDAALMEGYLSDISEHRRKLGEVFFFPSGRGVGLMGIIGEVGLESFSYYLADCPDIVEELMEINTRASVRWVQHLPVDHGIEGVFCGDDIAYTNGPLLAPRWFAKHYYDRLARVNAAYHEKGIKVLFHSDGDLNPIMDGLVEAGIDGLNPIKVLANMDVGRLHRRYPRLFLAGAIDVSQLLPLANFLAMRQAVLGYRG